MYKKVISKYHSLPVQAKASFWFLICSFMQRGISVITTPIFTRLLSTYEYGQVGVFNSWLDIVSIFVTLRLYYGVFVQGLVKYEDDKLKYASSLQGLEFLLCLVWTVVYILFHRFWNSLFGLTTVQMLALMLMVWTAGAFRFWAAEQRNEFKYKALVLLTLLVSVAKPLLGIFMVIHAEDKVTARILGLAIAELIGYSGCFIYQMVRGKQFYSSKYWKHALLFNLPLIPHYLSQTVLNNVDRIMIRDMVGASEAGIYGLAYSISKVMSLFNQALTQTITPWMYQKIKAHKEGDIAIIAFPALAGIAVINLILIAFAPEIVVIFAPPEYYNAIWIIPPVAMSVYFMFSYHLFACFEFYFEKTSFIMIASVFGAFLNILLNYFLISRFGYYAAGYTTLLCYMIYAVGHFVFMRKVCNKFLQGVKVYNINWLLYITGIFLSVGFLLLATYSSRYYRYPLIIVLSFILICKKERIKCFVKQLIDIRRKKRN